MSTQKKSTTKKSKIIAFWRKIDKKEALKIFSFFVITSAVSITCCFRIFPSKKLVVGGILISALLTVMLVYATRKNMPLEKIFLILAIPLGLLFLLFIPIGGVPDEPNHFFRAFEISQGKLVTFYDEENGSGAYVSPKIDSVMPGQNVSYSNVKENLSLKFSDQDDAQFRSFPNTSIYFFTCYLPQAIGMVIGNILNLPILMIAYLGRLFNFIIWLIAVFFCIKYCPILKKIILFVSLLPMTLQQAASLSPDTITFVAALALFSFVFYHIYHQKEQFRKKDWILLCILCIIMGMCKYVYVPLCLLILLIPAMKFGGERKKKYSILAIASGVVLLNIAWYLLTSKFFTDLEGVDAARQAIQIIRDPMYFVFVLVNTVFVNGQFIIESIFGRYLEWFNIDLTFIFSITMIVVFCILVYRYRAEIIRLNLKRIPCFVVFCILAFTAIIEYLKWTPVGGSYIEGIQGRYFLPILFMAPVLFMRSSKETKIQKFQIDKNDERNQKHSIYLYQLLLSVNVLALLLIVAYHTMI